MSKEKLQRQTEAGRRAEIVLQELDAAFKELEEDCFQTFRESSVHDQPGHQSVRMYLRVLDDIKDRLARAVTYGETARKELVRFDQENPS